MAEVSQQSGWLNVCQSQYAQPPIRQQMRSAPPTHFHVHFRRWDRAEVQETNFGILPVHLFIPVAVSVRARGGVEQGQPTGAASIVSHAQKRVPPRAAT
jgi:hypothetical protein